MAADETYDVLLRVKSEGDEQLKQLSRALVTVQQTSKAAGNQLVQTNNQVSASTDRMRNGFQNLGFQVQDFAVQVGGGTSALRAFSQQMPQAIGALQGMFGASSKLGAFLGGPWGVALGVAAAALGPLISKLFDTGDAMEDVGEKAAAMRGQITSATVSLAQNKLDEAMVALDEARNTTGRGARQTARAIEMSLPALREALNLAQGFSKLNAMGLDLGNPAKAKKVKVDNSAAKAAAKDAKDAADLIEAANAGVIKSFNEMEAAAKAAKKTQDDFVKTLEQAANPALAFADDLTRLYDLMDRGAISQQALDLAVQKSMQNLSDAVGKLNEDPQAKKIAERQKEAAAEVVAAWQSVGDSISDAFGQLVAKTSSVRDVVRSLVADILTQLAKIAIKKFVANIVSSAATASAKGNVFDSKGLVPFAKGGVVNTPTLFPFANGTGLMGEAGPEAIMPLQRDAQGKLGVAAAPVSINVINNAGAQVAVRETGPGAIDIIISRAVEASRQAIASDFRRGGSDVARSVERAYGVNRGAGAF